MTFNLYDQFHSVAQEQGDRVAILGPGKGSRLTYRELDAAIIAMSERLRETGALAGQCIGVHLPSSIAYIVCTYAVWRCGACAVPIPVELSKAEKAEISKELALDWVISGPRGTAWPALEAAPQHQLDDGLVAARMAPARKHPAGFESINAAFIRFTSGTTGTSKGVVLSHETIEERIAAANQVLRIGPQDRVLWVLSMSYHFTVSIVGYLSRSAAIVLPGNHFAAAIYEAMLQGEATVLYASPMHFAMLADYAPGGPLGALRLAISTTAPLDSKVAEAFAKRYQRPVSQALGIIEAGLPFINLEPTPERWGSVGGVLPGFELRLDDVGLGEHLGEVLIRGPGFLDAYYSPFRTRAEIMDDGWFHTGDVGRLDVEGRLFLTGRSKDIINVMGMKFFPQEVERVLSEHPQVAAAAVYGQVDNHWGETVKARVVLKHATGDAELAHKLKQHCRGSLAAYKVPQQIEFVPSLPRTASGKILHRVLAAG